MRKNACLASLNSIPYMEALLFRDSMIYPFIIRM